MAAVDVDTKYLNGSTVLLGKIYELDQCMYVRCDSCNLSYLIYSACAYNVVYFNSTISACPGEA